MTQKIRSKIKISSCKQKGRMGQKEIVSLLLNTFKILKEDDIRSTPMGSKGEDILLSSLAHTIIPWDIEVKRGKAFNLVNACKQASDRNSSYKPVAMGRYDRDNKWYATIELDYLLELILKIYSIKNN